MLPRQSDLFEVPGLQGRVWSCRQPSAETWLLAGYTSGVLARAHHVGQVMARLMDRTVEDREKLVAELTAAVQSEEAVVSRIEAMLHRWRRVLPEVVQSVEWQGRKVRVVLVQSPEEEAEAEDVEHVHVGNTALLDDWHAIEQALLARFGRGAELGERFRDRAAGGPAAGGSSGA